MDDRPLYNSRIIALFIKLLAKKYRSVDVGKLLDYINIKPYEVADEGHWFTQSQVNLFYERLVQITGNPNIARQAGQFAASGEGLGFTKKYLLGLVGPANAFAAVNKASANFSRSCSYESRKIASNKVEITATPHAGVVERPFQCENRIGFFEAFLMMFDHNIHEIEHPECMFAGGRSCRYVITWKKTPSSRLKAARNYLGLTLVASALILAKFLSWQALSTMITVSVVVELALSLIARNLENSELHAALLNLKGSSEELLEQVNVNYNNALMVNDVGLAISKFAGLTEVLGKVIEALHKRLDYDICFILIADKNRTKLAYTIGFGFTDEQLNYINNNDNCITSTAAEDIFAASFREQIPILANNFKEIQSDNPGYSLGIAERFDLLGVVSCPIVCDGESLGILAVGNTRRKKALVESDMSLMMGIAAAIGMSISNAKHMEHEQQMMEQLQQSQKMEAIGQLAAGVAHEINNPIGFISSNLRTLNNYTGKLIEFMELQAEKLSVVGGETQEALLEKRKNLRLDFVTEDIKGLVAESLDGTERIQRIVQDLKSFSRIDDNGFKDADINQCLESTISIVWNEIKYKASLDRKFGDLPLTRCNAQQLSQVFMNLLVNASHAIEKQGEITLTTWAADGHINISVADTGNGIPPENLTRIFEPFFTTKDVGKGTGLGLSISYDIVRKHKGEISVESVVGKGTIFTVRIPVTVSGQSEDRLTEVQA